MSAPFHLRPLSRGETESASLCAHGCSACSSLSGNALLNPQLSSRSEPKAPPPVERFPVVVTLCSSSRLRENCQATLPVATAR